ncbi:SAM-dependent methyltransferase [Piscinibacter gummiphilus]|uniref:SAM-dependent methyltransferase n=1 Tax=Piscinibacter gummiphilus TaxID=946333 RepID=UPI000A26FFCB|nr:class I SAM-dependent methyltransferase [Piscinibacter gummiphilus]ATU65823.1 class I SAM-dependent methyltransferase [Piscinibacter gummiphilus]GLS93697.1 hypothetical protein GCM10007918_09880 [Piscinibacter gummiphilus]
MNARPDVTLAPPSLPPREPAASHPAVFHRFAAELKALGRPFPRALDLGSGRGDLAAHVLREVPGLRLVTLDFSDTPQAPARTRLASKEGRRTHVVRHLANPGWADGLGRFDAVISHDAVHTLLRAHRPTAFYAQVRALLLPGAVFLLADRSTGDHDGASPYLTPDEQREAFDAAGWTSADILRNDHHSLYLKAHP